MRAPDVPNSLAVVKARPFDPHRIRWVGVPAMFDSVAVAMGVKR